MPGLMSSRSSSRGLLCGRSAVAAILVLAAAGGAEALDPPHDSSWAIDCSSCHTSHTSPGGNITTGAGNANLCLSCHVIGGLAEAFPFVDADQALPAPGLPTGSTASGTSHRWDSGPAGHVKPGAGNTSVGKVIPGGVFSGPYPKTYTVTITSAGDSGVAAFSWSDTLGGGAAGLTSGAGVVLDEGVSVSFVDGASSPSFLAGDGWRIFVRTDLRLPTDPEMAVRLEDGRTMCSTCHDQHKQLRTPFDPAAPPYAGSGTGEGRHFMRVDNDEGNMCNDCHDDRVVTTAIDGSHPVDIFLPGSGNYQAPASLPLDPADRVVCMTCHQVHVSATTDGSLLRESDRLGLCGECHTLADTTTPAAHLNPASSGALWPGGPDLRSFPAIEDVSQTGTCANCHQAHGWPDIGNPAVDYPRLQVDFEEDLCTTCHDGDPAATDVLSDLLKASAHPMSLASGVHQPGEPAIVLGAVRHVECADCHGPHDAVARVDLPGPATAPRPASGPLTGVRGISTAGTEVIPASYEYEVCFRCHADSTGMPLPPTERQFPSMNVREEFGGTFPSYHPVTTAGVNPDVPSLIGSWATDSVMSCTSCHNNDDGPVAGGAGANGPHGSDWPSLLEERYDTDDDGSNFNQAKYALCFKCHSWSNLASGASFDDHSKHVSGERTPCNVCHDPHASEGSPKLINFDTTVVSPFGGTLEFRSTGRFQGECTLTCHGEDHDPYNY